MSDGALYITIGIPGCGKSTWAQRALMADKVDIVVSSDAIREELTGDATNQDLNGEVFRVLERRVHAGLHIEKRVLVDATNLKVEYRKNLLQVAARHAVPAFALRFSDSNNYDLCRERNQGRDRVVPEVVMERFHTMFLQNCSTEQLIAEGWKVITVGPVAVSR